MASGNNTDVKNVCDTTNVLSFTTTTAKRFVFSHIWNIHGISHILTRDLDSLKSSDFPIISDENSNGTGCKWNLEANFTHYNITDHAHYLSLYLCLVSNQQSRSVTAGYRFSLLDADNQPLKQWGCQEQRHKFNYVYPASNEYLLKINDLKNPSNNYLEGDRLRLRCEVWMDGDIINHAGEITEDRDQIMKQDDLLRIDFKSLFEDPKFHDIVVATSAKKFRTHKAILCARSSVFSAMLQTQMAEALNGIIVIEDFKDEIVKDMLRYMYCGEVKNLTEETILDLLRIADKYDMQGLQEICIRKIPSVLSVTNAIDILVSVDLYDLPEIKSKILGFMAENKKTMMETKAFENLVNVDARLMMKIFHDMV